jgi:glutamine---fructose-6-phosphate transaminase (isomerizing)
LNARCNIAQLCHNHAKFFARYLFLFIKVVTITNVDFFMCGIIGYAGSQNVTPLLIEGLKRMEYRGYDSAGVAVISADNTLQFCKEKGKVSMLQDSLERSPIHGHMGIAHTRWATHGVPDQKNAHPHYMGSIAIVHNGIIENHHELRSELEAQGAIFMSDTDSEVISQYLYLHTLDGTSLEDAFKQLLPKLQGAYGVVIIDARTPDKMLVAKQGSPLVIGLGEDGNWVASDTIALSGCASKGIHLLDGQHATITADDVIIYDINQNIVTTTIVEFGAHSQSYDKGNYAHFMLKEIYEQPDVLRSTITNYFNAEKDAYHFPKLLINLSDITSLTIIACGTSFYSAQVASYWFEQLAHIPVRIDIASEFRYRKPRLPEGNVTLFISQSGETADTLAAMRHCKELGRHTVAMVNVMSSTMAREADSTIQTYAGAEIGVASTKAFTAQLTTLACLVLEIARSKKTINETTYQNYRHLLSGAADLVQDALQDADKYDSMARALMYARDMLFIGRGTSYPLANEGALKMKEISYIHAEGYAAGELKHGPIALVDDGVPIIVIAPDDALFEKTASNLEETAARKGNIVLISSKEKIATFKGNVTHSAALPHCDPFISPILYAIPLQLLSYYVALHKGADIDQPRNLAKSVTVE